MTEERKQDEKEEDRLEREFRTKHKLFGNIEFVGELFKQSIVTDQIMNKVLSSLVGLETEQHSKVNDNTVEAAIKLITKLGPVFETRLQEQKASGKL